MDSMSEDFERALRTLMKASDHDDGDEAIALAEEAVIKADLSGEFSIQFYAREQLVRAATFGGEPEKALVAFSWLIAHFNQRPEAVSEWSILWKYKWILNEVYEFPHLSKARIEEMMRDFEDRSIRAGFGLYAAYNFRYAFEKFRGNRQGAIEYYEKMMATAKDDLSNCPTCVLDERVSFAIYCGEDKQADELSSSILLGEMKCKSVPHRTYAKMLMPMVRLGKHDEAFNYHRAGYALIRQNKGFMDRVVQHMEFLVATRRLERALGLFRKHVSWLEQTRNLYHHFLFYSAAWLLFDVWAERSSEPLRLRLPLSLRNQSGEYDARFLAATFKQRASELAKRFDARNETDFFARTLREAPELQRLYATFPEPRNSGE
jgi:tetratricopeptide (TPR) repeat protein